VGVAIMVSSLASEGEDHCRAVVSLQGTGARLSQAQARSAIQHQNYENLVLGAANEQNSASQGSCENCVESRGFGALVCLVILANTTVLGLECQDTTNEKNQARYATMELAFVFIYMLEIFVRIGHHGWYPFFHGKDSLECGWNWFDVLTSVAGVIGVICEDAIHVKINASVLRLLRMLRILRFFRLFRFLKDVEYTFVSAMFSALRIASLVLMINYIGAVIITYLLHDTEDEVVLEMFGQLTTSMYYLFTVMVAGPGAIHFSEISDHPGGLVVITDHVMGIYPMMWIFWVTFIFLSTISLIALSPAILVELNLRDIQVAHDKQVKQEWEARIERQRNVLESIFQAADVDGSNSVSREEVDTFLQTKGIVKYLGLDRQWDEDHIYHGIDQPKEKMDVSNLRMEFTMVYDDLEADGRRELSCDEFIESFKQMRAKPMDQVVLILQQELYKLRTLIMSENKMLQDELCVLLESECASRDVCVDGGGGGGRGRSPPRASGIALSVPRYSTGGDNPSRAVLDVS